MSSRQVQILIADDEEGIRFVLERLLEDMDCCVSCAEDGTQAMDLIRSGPPGLPDELFDLAILDIKMPGATGIEVLEFALKKYPELIVLMVTAFGTPELARDAMKKGAYDYFTKPFDVGDMRQVIQRALEKKHLLEEIGDLKDQISQQEPFHNIIGESEPMRQVFELIERVCDNDV